MQMFQRNWVGFITVVLATVFVVGAVAQFPFGGRSRRGSPDRSEYPMWDIDPAFDRDVFTFARIQFDSYGRRSSGGGGGWSNDYPDCDWNLSARLEEVTSMKVNPHSVILRLTDENLCDYPFIFMSNVQGMTLTEPEVVALRQYLMKGGFLMGDDFWTPAAWRHVMSEMERVFPGRKSTELALDHPIFNIVYEFKEIPRIASIRAWERNQTVEDWHGSFEGDDAPHFRAYYDDDGRIMALFCHNNDVGDGFEREGENKEYFEQYSVRVSFPLAINIITYAMTH